MHVWLFLFYFIMACYSCWQHKINTTSHEHGFVLPQNVGCTNKGCMYLRQILQLFLQISNHPGSTHMPQICFNTMVQLYTPYALRIIYVTAFYSTASVRLGMGHCFVKLGKLDKARYKELWIRFLIKKIRFWWGRHIHVASLFNSSIIYRTLHFLFDLWYMLVVLEHYHNFIV